MSLASLLPYDHPYAGGYPGIGSQPLPTDTDALDYLARVKAADGAGVETGVAVAVDAFVRDTKAAGVFSALKACCLLAGARTLAGALVPLAGDAPTSNGFVSGDFSRTSGLTGDGTSYLDSGRNNNADPQNDFHMLVYETEAVAGNKPLMGCGVITNENGVSNFGRYNLTNWFTRSRHGAGFIDQSYPAGPAGLAGSNRSASSTVTVRSFGVSTSSAQASQTPFSGNITVFGLANIPSFTSNTLAFYSIGTAIPDLDALEASLENLINRLKFALLTGENPAPYDIDTVAYVVLGYENGSTLQ